MREFQVGDHVSFKLHGNRVIGTITEDLGENKAYPLKVKPIDPKAIGWSTYDALCYTRQGEWFGGDNELVLIEPSINHTGNFFYIEPLSSSSEIVFTADDYGVFSLEKEEAFCHFWGTKEQCQDFVDQQNKSKQSEMYLETYNLLNGTEPKQSKLEKILDLLDQQGIDQVTFNAHSFDEEYQLPCDDKDYVTFHKRHIGNILIADKLLVCDYQTTETPIYKDWVMTINYHS